MGPTWVFICISSSSRISWFNTKITYSSFNLHQASYQIDCIKVNRKTRYLVTFNPILTPPSRYYKFDKIGYLVDKGLRSYLGVQHILYVRVTYLKEADTARNFKCNQYSNVTANTPKGITSVKFKFNNVFITLKIEDTNLI